jgi:exonuclease VII small subunit
MTTKPTINERISELNKEVEWFYGDDFSLDQAVEKYKETLAHAQSIQKDLQSIKNEVVKIEQDFTKTQS